MKGLFLYSISIIRVIYNSVNYADALNAAEYWQSYFMTQGLQCPDGTVKIQKQSIH